MKTSIRTTFQVLSLVSLAALAIYLAPKYSNPFKYHFEVGQPWAYGLVTAESDFAIYKTEAQLEAEYQQVLRDYTPCYMADSTALQDKLYVLSLAEMERLQAQGYSKVSVLNNRVATQVAVKDLYTPKEKKEKTLKHGVR